MKMQQSYFDFWNFEILVLGFYLAFLKIYIFVHCIKIYSNLKRHWYKFLYIRIYAINFLNLETLSSLNFFLHFDQQMKPNKMTNLRWCALVGRRFSEFHKLPLKISLNLAHFARQLNLYLTCIKTNRIGSLRAFVCVCVRVFIIFVVFECLGWVSFFRIHQTRLSFFLKQSNEPKKYEFILLYPRYLWYHRDNRMRACLKQNARVDK